MSRHHGNPGRPYRRNRELVLKASDVCGLCHHPGADGIDHIVPVSLGGARDDIRNMQPAHTTQPCPVCGKRCNPSRKNRLDYQASTTAPSRRWY